MGMKEEVEVPKKWHCEIHKLEFRVRSELRDHLKEFGCKSRHKSNSENNSKSSDTDSSEKSPRTKRGKEGQSRNNANDSQKAQNEVDHTTSYKNKNKYPDENSCDDVLDLRTTETFDELDFEPDDSDLGGSVSFKSLNSNFSIPKKQAVESKNKTEESSHKNENKRSSRRDVENYKKDRNEPCKDNKTSSRPESSKVSTNDANRDRERRGRSKERSRRK